MYNITELHDMPDEQLKAVAESMGIKKINLSDREGLVYTILDQQAAISAATTTAKRRKAAESAQNEEKQPKKRGPSESLL